MEDKIITLELTIGEVNGILGAVGKMPFEQVSGLVEKIRQQAVPQVQKIRDEAESTEPAAE